MGTRPSFWTGTSYNALDGSRRSLEVIGSATTARGATTRTASTSPGRRSTAGPSPRRASCRWGRAGRASTAGVGWIRTRSRSSRFRGVRGLGNFPQELTKNCRAIGTRRPSRPLARAAAARARGGAGGRSELVPVVALLQGKIASIRTNAS